MQTSLIETHIELADSLSGSSEVWKTWIGSIKQHPPTEVSPGNESSGKARNTGTFSTAQVGTGMD